MADPELNIPLLRKAVEWAEAEAAKPFELCEWRQAMWVTTLDEEQGRAWGLSGERTTHEGLGKSPECGTCFCVAGFVVASTDGPGATVIEKRATELLGLTIDQRSKLFRATNTIEDVRRIAEDIAGERL